MEKKKKRDYSKYYKAKNVYNVRRSQTFLLEKVKEIKCICPGCLEDFSSCSDRALLMIFERCHYHHRKCSLRKKEEFFIGCRLCNHSQFNKCGKFVEGKFIPITDCGI